MLRTVLRRGVAVLAVAVVGVLASAAAASAHVTVDPTSAPRGGYAVFTFRVPNEQDDATTTKVELALPAAHPFASVSVKSVPGWTATTVTTKLATPITNDDGQKVSEAISRVIWTASTAAAIKPGEFQEFELSVGPLPSSGDSVEFKALQTYSNGTIVRWIQDQAPGAAEPENPAPVVTLTGAEETTASTSPAADASSTSSSGTSGVAVAALVVGIVGVLLGGGALGMVLRRRG